MSGSVTFQNVSKHYRGARTYRALRDDITAVMKRAAGGESASRPVVEALNNVSFEVPEGQSMALIGLNGAGKTTALKIMSRITYPTSGVVRVHGRVGALLEVGTGMHPELTGRENVHLYGRIIGLTGRQIERRFDEVVDFAGIGAAIDQQVKHYSSGMQLRLGFSVAAHLEPNVLLVDEAIAVGDAGFQYRCVERMRELVQQGMTLVFVSHDMNAIETLCERAVLIKKGRVAQDGPAREVIRDYMAAVHADLLAEESGREAVGEELQVTRVSVHDGSGDEVSEVPTGGPLTIRLHYRTSKPIPEPLFSVGLGDGRLGCFAVASMLGEGAVAEVLSGEGHLDCTFPSIPLRPRIYEIWIGVRGAAGFGKLIEWQRLRRFKVAGGAAEGAGKGALTVSMLSGPVDLHHEWRLGTAG